MRMLNMLEQRLSLPEDRNRPMRAIADCRNPDDSIGRFGGRGGQRVRIHAVPLKATLHIRHFGKSAGQAERRVFLQ